MARSTLLLSSLDAAIVEEPRKPIPVVQRIADRLGGRASGGQFRYLRFEPGAQFASPAVCSVPGVRTARAALLPRTSASIR